MRVVVLVSGIHIRRKYKKFTRNPVIESNTTIIDRFFSLEIYIPRKDIKEINVCSTISVCLHQRRILSVFFFFLSHLMIWLDTNNVHRGLNMHITITMLITSGKWLALAVIDLWFYTILDAVECTEIYKGRGGKNWKNNSF